MLSKALGTLTGHIRRFTGPQSRCLSSQAPPGGSAPPKPPRRGVDVSTASPAMGPHSAFQPALGTPMLPDGTFSGKIALITGGGTGLGKAMARQLSRLGGTVFITSRKLDVLQGAAEEIGAETGLEVVPLPCDVRDPEQVRRMYDALMDKTGGLPPSLVVNNAAGNFVAPFERMTPNGFKAITETVLNGTAFVTLEGGNRLIAAGRGGVFLCITTTYAETGSGFVAASAAAKSGVSNLVRSLSVEWGRYGIRTVGIAPGPIQTKGAFTRLDPTGRFLKLLTDRLPAHRLGEKGELANLATYLLSPYASWITGTVVTLDGGETAALSGEFNTLTAVTPAQWDGMEALIRSADKPGGGAEHS